MCAVMYVVYVRTLIVLDESVAYVMDGMYGAPVSLVLALPCLWPVNFSLQESLCFCWTSQCGRVSVLDAGGAIFRDGQNWWKLREAGADNAILRSFNFSLAIRFLLLHSRYAWFLKLALTMPSFDLSVLDQSLRSHSWACAMNFRRRPDQGPRIFLLFFVRYCKNGHPPLRATFVFPTLVGRPFFYHTTTSVRASVIPLILKM